MSAAAITPNFSIPTAILIVSDIWRFERWRSAVDLQVFIVVFGCVSRERVDWAESIFCWDSVFYVDFLLRNYPSLLFKPLVHLSLIESALLGLFPEYVCDIDCKVRNINHSCDNLMNSLGPWYTLFCSPPSFKKNKKKLRKALFRTLMTSIRIMDITFESDLISVARPASPTRCMTAFPIKAGIIVVCSCTVLSSLVNWFNRMGGVVKTGGSSNRRQSGTASNVSWSCAHGVVYPLRQMQPSNILAHLASSDGLRCTLRGRNSVAVAEYTFLVSQCGNYVVAFLS